MMMGSRTGNISKKLSFHKHGASSYSPNVDFLTIRSTAQASLVHGAYFIVRSVDLFHVFRSVDLYFFLQWEHIIESFLQT